VALNSLPLVDSHCHLDVQQFADDRHAVIQRARDAGVRLMVVPGIDLEHCRQALALAAENRDIYVAVGIHPNETGDFDAATLATVEELSAQPKVVALGEIGLDYYWQRVPRQVQWDAFEAQLSLAARLGLPVIIHNRDAHADIAAVLSAWVAGAEFAASPLAQRPYAGVLHAFGGDLALAEAATTWNFVLSLGGPVTFTNAKQLHALVPQLRRERLMLETDAPYLTPHPHRGKRNEPAYVALICEQLAALYGLTPAQVAWDSTQLALRFFGLDEQQIDVTTLPPSDGERAVDFHARQGRDERAT
jgi:TatD DNase family protein